MRFPLLGVSGRPKEGKHTRGELLRRGCPSLEDIRQYSFDFEAKYKVGISSQMVAVWLHIKSY